MEEIYRIFNVDKHMYVNDKVWISKYCKEISDAKVFHQFKHCLDFIEEDEVFNDTTDCINDEFKIIKSYKRLQS